MYLRQQGIDGVAPGGGVGQFGGLLEGVEGGGCLPQVAQGAAQEVMGMDTVVVGAVTVEIVGELVYGVQR